MASAQLIPSLVVVVVVMAGLFGQQRYIRNYRSSSRYSSFDAEHLSVNTLYASGLEPTQKESSLSSLKDSTVDLNDPPPARILAPRNITAAVNDIHSRLSKRRKYRYYPSCKSCQPDQNQTSIFSLMRYDRSGAVIFNMLAMHAFAFSVGRTYGGACVKKKTIYRVAENMEMVDSLGLENDLIFSACDEMKETECMLLGEMNKECVRSNYTGYMTPEWRKHLQAKVYAAMPSPDLLDSNYTIAVHIRRGDIHPCKHMGRYLPNQHYMELINQVYKPGAVVKIYSEEESYESFQEFQDRGFHLFLSKSREEVWKGILYADAVILSPSSFSMVPAVLTRAKKILVTPYGEFPIFSHWDIVDREIVQRTHQWRRNAYAEVQAQCNTTVVL